jgi:hypothetical protein
MFGESQTTRRISGALRIIGIDILAAGADIVGVATLPGRLIGILVVALASATGANRTLPAIYFC